MSGDLAIVTDGLTKRFGDVVAVDRVELRVPRGEVYALLGLNGAGKTTTIRLVLGMVRPTGGTVRVLGTALPSRDVDVWRRVGYLVESPSAYPDLTVRENLGLVRRLRRLGRGEVDEVIERLGLGRYAGRRAGSLSSGNLQRLGLAKALIHGPDLLVLDEPTNGLDPAGVVEVRDMLRTLADQHGVAVFVSSHLLAEVTHIAGRIGVIHDGRLIRELDAGQLRTQSRSRLVVRVRDRAAALAVLAAAGYPATPVDGTGIALTGADAIDRPDDIATLLVGQGCPPTGLVVEGEDLERYFLRLVTSREVAA